MGSDLSGLKVVICRGRRYSAAAILRDGGESGGDFSAAANNHGPASIYAYKYPVVWMSE